MLYIDIRTLDTAKLNAIIDKGERFYVSNGHDDYDAPTLADSFWSSRGLPPPRRTAEEQCDPGRHFNSP